MIEGLDPFKYAVENYSKLKNKNKVIWLGVNDSHKVGGVELAAHGHIGIGGIRGSLNYNMPKQTSWY